MANKYNENSIQTMDPLTFCRHRPDSYLGSNEDSTQLAREIISNSSDEFLIGNCKTIYVDYDDESNIVKIADDGQGIIPNVFKDGKSILETVYGTINSSGKYDKSENAVYKVSTGAFGIGGALTNFLSHWLIATTKRDGQYETVRFNEGVFDTRETGECSKDEHGVTVEFQPNEEFFRDAKPNISKLKKELFNLSCVCKGLTVFFNGNKIYHPNGLSDIVEEKIGDDTAIISNPFTFENIVSDSQKFDFALSVTSKSTCEIIPFCNYSLIETGTPVTAVKSTITRVFNNYAKENKLITKGTLSGSDIQEGMVITFNLVSQKIRYDSQTKVRVTSTEDNSYISSSLGEQLEVWLDNNPSDAKSILEKAIVAKRAAEAAKKARAAVKNKTKRQNGYIKMPTSLSDCWSKNRSECELFLTEGKSASSGLVAGRDSKFQAIYGVRGKMLSVLKTKPENIIKNQEINNLIQALGLEFDQKTAKCKYDEKSLRYGKIITSTDADSDGNAISNLMLNIFWYICPELVTKGHVYCSEPPLFRVITKKNEYVYLKNDIALQEYKKKYSSKVKAITRMKGLGEQDSNELAYCLLEPETRNMKLVTVSDVKKTENMFNDLYGKKVEPRVKFLEEHLEEANIG